jgi:hypothetical protein
MHVIHEDSGKMIDRASVFHVPRVGDEIRYGEEGKEKYYRVTRVVWAFDESAFSMNRVNVGVVDA